MGFFFFFFPMNNYVKTWCDPVAAINQPQVSIIVAGYSKSSRWVWCGLHRRLAIFDMRVFRLAAINFNTIFMSTGFAFDPIWWNMCHVGIVAMSQRV